MTVPIPFVKMSGAGNDFVVLDRETWDSISGNRAAWVRGVTRRGLSVGSDGVLVVERLADGRVGVLFLNPDGGEAFCGNGSRCAARFASERLGAPRSLILATACGDVPARVDQGRVRLTLSPPVDLGERILDAAGTTVRARFVLTGVPHLVVSVSDVRGYPLDAIAPSLRRHLALGPEGANVNVTSADGAGRLLVRTWERGVENETLSCGTGAVAAAFVARLGGATETVEVVPAAGVPLRVTIAGDPAAPGVTWLEGDARFVFEGALSPEGIPEVV